MGLLKEFVKEKVLVLFECLGFKDYVLVYLFLLFGG